MSRKRKKESASVPADSGTRFWILYRQERRKVERFKDRLTSSQITRVSWAAQKRLEAEIGAGQEPPA